MVTLGKCFLYFSFLLFIFYFFFKYLFVWLLQVLVSNFSFEGWDLVRIKLGPLLEVCGSLAATDQLELSFHF